MERNFETVMIEQCAPVLAGLPGCAAGMTSWGRRG